MFKRIREIHLKTLKAKLFFSVGAIVLIVGALNIILAEIWIKRGLTRKGQAITNYVVAVEDKVAQFSSFLLTLRMVEEATDLERVAYMSAALEKDPNLTLWNKAEEIVSYDPQIAFVQIQRGDKGVVSIAPQDARLHPFSFLKNPDGTLLVKVEGKEGFFKAVLSKKNTKEDYLLFQLNQEDQDPSLEFEKIELKKTAYGVEDSVPKLFEALLSHENEWLYKMDLIQALLSWSGEGEAPLGAIKIAGEDGGCLWSNEVFSTPKPMKQFVPTAEEANLFLLVRKAGGQKDVDVVREFSLGEDLRVRLGFSVTRVLQQIALLSGKAILIKAEGVNLGIKSDGKVFSLKKEPDFLTKTKYISYDIDFSLFSITILTPEDEALAISRFLAQLGHDMVVNVSLSLLGAAFISFVVALILLRNISTKITQPIAVLSQAAEHLGAGQYEKIILPKIEHREDEVAKLTHSFSGMVNALQDRDKIRGVLHKVVSKEISEKILKGNLDFTGEERVLTLLFSDIRNFTKMSEGLSPRVLIPMLNLYMTRMCHIIDATHGVVDKFVGDEIMTLYGAPVELEFHAVLAVEAALRMMEDLSNWNEERRKENLPIFEIGIGVHTGLVYTGNMGAENRLNYTAIGSNVNLASRVCSIAKPMQILITEETFVAPGVKEKFKCKELEAVTLKGIELKVKLYEVLGVC